MDAILASHRSECRLAFAIVPMGTLLKGTLAAGDLNPHPPLLHSLQYKQLKMVLYCTSIVKWIHKTWQKRSDLYHGVWLPGALMHRYQMEVSMWIFLGRVFITINYLIYYRGFCEELELRHHEIKMYYLDLNIITTACENICCVQCGSHCTIQASLFCSQQKWLPEQCSTL